MNKLQDSLNNIDSIINQIEKNNYLKIDQGDNLRKIIELNKKDKMELMNKLETVEQFSKLLENIILTKPEPETLDKNLVDYIGYNNYYSKNKVQVSK